MNILEQLANFIDETKFQRFGSRRWLATSTMKVYVRRGHHAIAGKMAECLDIATIDVDHRHRGMGLCREFLTKAHEMNPWEFTYVESVVNPILAVSLLKRGYTALEHVENCYYLKTPV